MPADTTFDAYSCPYDGAGCLLLGPLAPELGRQAGADYPAVVGAAARVLPCQSCPRYSQTIVDGLVRVRLGKHERRVLLRAASPQAKEGAVIEPPGPGRSADEAQRRALRRLQRLGLVRLDWHSVGRYQPRWHRAVRLSPQGEAVVAQIGHALHDGRLIRWQRHKRALLAALDRPLDTLWAHFRTALSEAERRLRTGALEMSALYKMGLGSDALRQRVVDDLARAERLTLVLAALQAAGKGADQPGARV